MRCLPIGFPPSDHSLPPSTSISPAAFSPLYDLFAPFFTSLSHSTYALTWTTSPLYPFYFLIILPYSFIMNIKALQPELLLTTDHSCQPLQDIVSGSQATGNSHQADSLPMITSGCHQVVTYVPCDICEIDKHIFNPIFYLSEPL